VVVDFAERIKQLEAKVKEDSLRLKNIAKGILAKEQEFNNYLMKRLKKFKILVFRMKKSIKVLGL